MRTRIPSGPTVLALSSMVFCSCLDSGAKPAAVLAAPLPADVPINKGAGQGGYLKVMLHLEAGDEFECALDTGSPGILLPKCLESKLGECLGTRTFRTLGGTREGKASMPHLSFTSEKLP